MCDGHNDSATGSPRANDKVLLKKGIKAVKVPDDIAKTRTRTTQRRKKGRIKLKSNKKTTRRMRKGASTKKTIKRKRKTPSKKKTVKRKRKTYYDKIHMYDVRLSKKEVYSESKTFLKGNKIKVVKLPWGKLGMSICYDLRFSNMYRKMSKLGALFLSVPSAFTQTTGKRHWHSLLKARAIENFCYIFAPAQGELKKEEDQV